MSHFISQFKFSIMRIYFTFLNFTHTSVHTKFIKFVTAEFFDVLKISDDFYNLLRFVTFVETSFGRYPSESSSVSRAPVTST